MSGAQAKRRTILHFGTDHVLLLLRGKRLNRRGFHVLNSSNGLEAIALATLQPVDAIVLDLHRNDAEIALVAKELKRCRPHVPTVVVTEGTGYAEGAHFTADALVPHRDNLDLLVTALETVLAVPRA